MTERATQDAVNDIAAAEWGGAPNMVYWPRRNVE